MSIIAKKSASLSTSYPTSVAVNADEVFFGIATLTLTESILTAAVTASFKLVEAATGTNHFIIK